jgi:Icc protein
MPPTAGDSPDARIAPGLYDDAVLAWLAGADGADAAPPAFDALFPAEEPLTLARFSAPRTATPTTLAVLSDIHLSTREHGTWKLFHRSRDRLRAAVADVNRRADAVVVAGDLTEDGAAADFEVVAAELAELDVPYVAIPGNHDVPKSFDDHPVPPVTEFVETHTPGALPFHWRVGDLDLLCLDSAHADGALADTHQGLVTDDQLAWLDRTLPEAEMPVVVTHHNLDGLLAHTGGRSWRSSFPVRNAGALADVLVRHDVPLHLSGHLHLPAVAGGNGLRELVAPALCSFPGAYLLLEIGPDGTTVRVVPTSDREGRREAWAAAAAHSERSRMVARATVHQLAAAPLVDEHANGRFPAGTGTAEADD